MRVQIEGPQVLLEPDAAQAMAVALHELATNTAKYGALCTDKGRIKIKWSHKTDGRLILRWTEMAGPPVQTPTRQGFGGRVIAGIIDQLEGKALFDWRPEGLVSKSPFGRKNRPSLALSRNRIAGSLPSHLELRSRSRCSAARRN